MKTSLRKAFTAAILTERVGYANPTIEIRVFSQANTQFIFPNEPVLVDVVQNRSPSSQVFDLLPCPPKGK